MDDIQSWWEVPSIAHFCSLFRAAFNLLDFDIEELEEALLTDGTEDTGSSLLQELIVRLLCGCYGRNHGISIFNYQMFLRRLFRTKCREYGRENPFDSDIDFQFLPLRTKVEILQALCDFRLDADDVLDCLKNLESDSLRLQPLGYDRNQSAYWYFYGTRLYREDYPKVKKKEAPPKRGRKRIRPLEPGEEAEGGAEYEVDLGAGVWQVVCYTEEDWSALAEKTTDAPCKEEKTLHHVLTEDFLPEIPRLFEEKRNLQRKRLMEMAPRRQSTRIEKLKHSKEIERKLQKQKDEELRRQQEEEDRLDEEWRKQKMAKERAKRLENRERSGASRSGSEDRWTTTEDNSSLCSYQTSTGGLTATSTGRKTNNSLSAAMGEIILPPHHSHERHHSSKKHRRDHEYRSSQDDLRLGMYKIMNRLKSSEDAWPFCEPVDEETAPNYYERIKRPMDLTRMEEKLDQGRYKSFGAFRTDFQQIVDNCRKYNGLDNEYTDMVRRLQQIFRDSVSRYLDGYDDLIDPPPPGGDSSDEGGSDLGDRGTRGSSYPPPSPNEMTPPPKPKGKRGRKKKIVVLSPRSITPTDEEEDKENEDKCGPAFDSIPSNSESERDREEVESIKSLSNEPKPPKRRRGRPSKERPNNIPKNSSAAIEALELVTEQTLKDINKWLDDTPRFSEYSNSASNSPSQILGVVEDYESRARIEAEYQRTLSKIDKIDKAARKEALQQKRRLVKEQQAAAAALLAPPAPLPPPPPVKKKREPQRTIERLQPGKSKGNLISNTVKAAPQDDSPISGIILPLSKIREKEAALSLEEKDEAIQMPQMLSLGTVLTSDVIGFGITPKQHSFSEGEDDSKGESSGGSQEKNEKETKLGEIEEEKTELREESEEKIKDDNIKEEEKEERVIEVEKEKLVEEKVEDNEEEKEVVKKPETAPPAPAPAKETKPNFNAWFKAFGAPKVLPSTGKRKTFADFGAPGTPLSSGCRDSPEMRNEDTMDDIPDLPPPTPGRSLGLDEDRGVPHPAPRQRKLSTGSSMSERSSYSQEPDPLNSPRPSPMDEPYVSPQQPYHHSPNSAAPIKVGFYQDTFPRGSSDKSPASSCSNQNSPHLQIVSPVQSPKEPYYSNPLSPYPSPGPGVYDIPPPTPSYPSHSRDLPYFDRPPVYSVASGPTSPLARPPSSPPDKPPPTPNPTPSLSMYPVKKRVYTDTVEQSIPSPSHTPTPTPTPPPMRIMEHYPPAPDPRYYAHPHPSNTPHSSITLHSPYSNESPLGYTSNPKPPTGPELPTHTPYVHTPPSSQPTPTSDNTPLNYSNPSAPTPLNFANARSSSGSGYMAQDYSDPSKMKYEQLMSHMSARFNSPTVPTSTNSPQMPYPSNPDLLSNKLSSYPHPMYNYSDLMQKQFKPAGSPTPSNYPLSFNRPLSPQVFPNPNGELMNYHNKPGGEMMNYGKPGADLMNYHGKQSGDIMNYHNKPGGDMMNYHQTKPEEPPPKKPAAKKPRKKKNQPVVPETPPTPTSSISSGSTTAFQQYMGQNPTQPGEGSTLKPNPHLVPGTAYNFSQNPIKDSYSYLEDMRNSGYFLTESASPNVKTSTNSPFSFLPGSSRGAPSHPSVPSPNYSSLAQFMNPSTAGNPVLYQQYLQSVQSRSMMLGYPPGYLNMPPPHDRPPWGL
uniref:Cat eye syndrome critical region protein 2 n=1 Tax=Cacopsylla melanoneura TaxID=428564 RepID=A0A8D9EA60_9HEMI